MPARLLFDQNLAPRLARDLADLFPDSAYVRDLHLQAASDEHICVQAAAGGFVIVTKDDDFRQRSFLRGHPPKVIWVRLGNCRTADVAGLLRAREADVRAFIADPQLALLLLARRRR
jgi:predicted nuclease of predicted toxin-antitoxin system